MVSVIGEQGLGLFGHTQLGLGQSNTLGDAKTRLTVNAATGNLVITRRDDTLAGNGIDTDLLRTYNSQGTLNQGSVGQFRFGFDQSLSDFPADKTSGTIIRNDGEGLAARFTWNDSQQRYISTSGNGSFDKLHFDTANNQWVFTDGESLTTEIYDQAGQLQSITDKEGQTLSLQYQDGRLTEIVDASGNSTYLSYTDEGFVKRIHTLVDGNEHTLARYQYDELNRISKVVIDLTPSDNTVLDSAVYSTTYTYHQDSSRIATISHSDGSYTEFDYIEHNSKWYVNQISDGNGQLTRFNYDLVNNLTTMTDANGNEWQYLYNGEGQIVETRSPAVNGQIAIQYYQYDTQGNLAKVRDALGNTSQYQHDDHGNVTREQHADGSVIERTYNNNNQLLTETLSQLDPQTDTLTSLGTSRYVYDEKGLLLFQVSGEGRVTQFEYNAKGQLTSQFTYPEVTFNVANYSIAQAIILLDLQAWQGMQDKSKRSRTDYLYDIRGQLQRSQEFSRVDINGIGISNEQMLEVHYQYDLSGRLIAQATLRGQESEVQHFDYDGLGRLVSQSDNAGNTSSWIYDDAQRTITLTHANGAKEVQLRDQTGQVIQASQVSLLDQVRDTLYRYDNQGRQIAKQSPAGVREYQFYDAKGQLAATVDGTGAFTQFEYDLNGNQTKTTQYATRIDTSTWWGEDALTVSDYLALLPTVNNQDRISENFYDNRNRVSHTVDAEGYITRNFYDNNSRLIRTEQLSSSEAQRLGLKVEISNSKRLIEQDNVDPFGTPGNDVIVGNDKADTLYGYDGDDVLDGKDSNDNLQGGAGSDTLYGGEGKDYLRGGDDNDTLLGGYGIDNLDGDKGDDLLIAGSGNDTISARQGNNTIIGGAGNDIITTDYNANNTIVYAKGDGWDSYTQGNNNPEFTPATDVIRFEDLKSDEILIYWSGSYLHLQNPEDDGGIRIYIIPARIPFSQVEFSDGITLTWAEVEARANKGISLSETISPSNNRDQVLNGAGGNDSITTLKGNDTLFGGTGNDLLSSGEGDDTLIGGTGNDSLTGSYGSDSYIFGKGFGFDTVDNTTYAQDIGKYTDRIVFDETLTRQDIVFERTGNHLYLRNVNSSDHIKITNYFYTASATRYNVAEIVFSTGETYSFSDVSAMQLQLGSSKSDRFSNLYGLDTIHGYQGNDYFNGTAENEIVFGDQGNDMINTSDGDDVLIGGAGNDTLYGGKGSDVYYFDENFGRDSINNSVNNTELPDVRVDVVTFSANINKENVILYKHNNELKIYIKGTSDSLAVGGHFSSSSNSNHTINEIRFESDDSVWTKDEFLTIVEQHAIAYDQHISSLTKQAVYADSAGGTLLADVNQAVNLYGSDDVDTLVGSKYSDTIEGRKGNDTLIGGAGNDSLTGGYGGDVYIFEAGFGIDTVREFYFNDGDINRIVFSDYNLADVIMDGSTLYLGNDQLNIQEFFPTAEGKPYRIAEFEFADGSIISSEELVRLKLQGSSRSESLGGSNGNDTLIGAEGNDSLVGGHGNDVYYFEPGFGQDTINNHHAGSIYADVIRFGAGIGSNDVVIYRSGNHLYITVNDTSDYIKVEYYFNSDAYKVGAIEFSDGTVWSENDIHQRSGVLTDQVDANNGAWIDADLIYARDGNDTISGDSGDNAFYGEKGNDRLTGGDGDDTLIGGQGNDSLIGGSGDDTLIGGTGNDRITDGTGNNTFIYEQGFGDDYLNVFRQASTEATNVINFGAGIEPGNVIVNRSSNNDLVLTFRASEDKLTIDRFFQDEPYAAYVDEINFANGTRWTLNAIRQLAIHTSDSEDLVYGYDDSDESIAGLGGNDKIYGGDGDDYLKGDDGSDTLSGDKGDDYLAGGADNDSLIGGIGNDFLQGNAGNDSLNAGVGDDTLVGGTGSDSLLGDKGNDTLMGGAGNDLLQGGQGIDEYHFSAGFGRDTISLSASSDNIIETDKIIFSSDFIKENLIFHRNSTGDLIITLQNSDDQLVISRLFNAPSNYYDTITLQVGGEILSVDDILNILETTTDYDQYLYARYDGGTLVGGLGADNLTGSAVSDKLVGGEGNDVLLAVAGDDELIGGAGNDTLTAGTGNDTLIGGIGHDVLDGSTGSDVYIFESGFGQDVIKDTSSAGDLNIIKFGAGITANDLTIYRYGGTYSHQDALVISIKDTNDQISVSRYSNLNRNINSIEFSDGTSLTSQEIFSLSQQSHNYSEYLETSPENYSLNGQGGNDIIYGSAENDILIGGTGNDSLYSQAGSDTLYGGAGNDKLTTSGTDNTLFGGSGNDQITGGSGQDTIFGGSGDDNLGGYQGHDTLIGGTGNDTFSMYNNSATDNDLLIFGADFGHDLINSNSVGFSIKFIDGINSEDIDVYQKTSSLILINNKTQDSISISSGISIYSDTLNQIEFSDGAIWSNEQILAKAYEANDNNQYLTSYNNIALLDGGAGNDSIHGANIASTLIGGAGADSLYAGSGNDTLIGGEGDDILTGNRGDDVYLFSLGFGHDRITNHSSSNKNNIIRFDASINAADVSINQWENVSASNHTLTLIHEPTGDRVDIAYQLYESCKGIKQVEFSNGVIWDAAYLAANATINTSLKTYSISNTLLTSGEALLSGWQTDLRGSDENDILRIDSIHPDSRGQHRLYGNDGNDTLSADSEVLITGAYNSYLSGGAGNDTLYGGAGASNLSGGIGTDTIIGGSGNEGLTGGADNDYLEGGKGNDTLNGGTGSDIYYFSKGFGNDSLNTSAWEYQAGDVDIIRFDSDISKNDLSFFRSNTSLTIIVTATGDSLSISNYFNLAAHFSFELEDGSSLTNTDIRAAIYAESDYDRSYYLDSQQVNIRAGAGKDNITGDLNDNVIHAGNHNDIVSSGNGNDILWGESGNDKLTAGDGDDTLIGGTGNDALTGGKGSDTYVFNKGFGTDTITEIIGESSRIILADINQDDIRIRRETPQSYIKNFVIYIPSTEDKIIVSSVFGEEVFAHNYTIQFADGSEWSMDEINRQTQIPTNSRDEIHADFGNNTLVGYGGHDTLKGYSRDDVLSGGDGKDNIYGGGGRDTLSGDRGNDSLSGDDDDDSLYGGIGADTLIGGEGDDYIDAGSGNDIIYGNNDTYAEGNDTIIGGAGDDKIYDQIRWFLQFKILLMVKKRGPRLMVLIPLNSHPILLLRIFIYYKASKI